MCHSQKRIPFKEINNLLFPILSRVEIILIKDTESIFSMHTNLNLSGFSPGFSNQLVIQYQMAGPENVYSGNIIQTKKIIFVNI